MKLDNIEGKLCRFEDRYEGLIRDGGFNIAPGPPAKDVW